MFAVCDQLRFQVPVNNLLGLEIRRLPGEHAVHHRAEGVNVPPGVRRGREVRLLRSHVEERAKGRRHLVGEPRLPEVRQPRAAVVVEQDVRGLQIAVQDSLVVRVDQGNGDLAEVRRGVVTAQRSVAEKVFERAVLHVLHHVVRRIGFPADLEELHDVAIGEEIAKLLHLAGEAGPVDAAAAGVDT